MADISNAETVLDVPNVVPHSAEGIRLEAIHGHDNRPADGPWLAYDDRGDLVGHAVMAVTHWDNPELAFAFCSVHPVARGRGIGTALLDTQVQAARDLGRSKLLTFGFEGYRANFLTANGFELGQ